MNLVDEIVTHEIFGEGSVVKYNDSYIKINFKSGDKRFSFPDAFKDHIKFVDERATNEINKKIAEVKEQRKKEEIILEKEKALEREERYIKKQRENLKSGKVHSRVQSVFWYEEEEDAEIFENWEVFTGEIKSGKKEGQPRKLARMNQNSACLITARKDDDEEENRRILGLFLVNRSFDGRLCEDGYITAHPEYRIQLSPEESEKMLFWNYYFDKKSPTKTIWNSGRQRYYDNMMTAQILQDIVNLKESPEEKKPVEEFLEYFCRINSINPNELPEVNGALVRAENKKEEA